MTAHYDLLLVMLSVLIAICGGYTCFHMMDRLTRLSGASWKSTVLAAAVAIGGGIWSMHFVGMLAMHMPVAISYDLQGTLLSALIAVGVTAVALYVVTVGRVTAVRTVLSGLLLGFGISGMHYVGMDAIRGNIVVTYDPGLVVVSVLVGAGASIMALYLALRVRNKLKQVPAAIAMGVGISGMHYTGMLAVSFAVSGDAVAIASPVIENASMAVVITIAAFFLLGSTFFLAAPVPDTPRREEKSIPGMMATNDASPGDAADVDPALALKKTRIPVQAGKRRTHVYADEIVCVHADSHYTRVCSLDEEFFCSLSISEIERKLEPHGFLRVHRSHMVNVRQIKVFNRQKEHGEVMVMVAGSELQVPVSRGKMELLRATLNSFGMSAITE